MAVSLQPFLLRAALFGAFRQSQAQRSQKARVFDQKEGKKKIAGWKQTGTDAQQGRPATSSSGANTRVHSPGRISRHARERSTNSWPDLVLFGTDDTRTGPPNFRPFFKGVGKSFFCGTISPCSRAPRRPKPTRRCGNKLSRREAAAEWICLLLPALKNRRAPRTS